MLLHFRETKVDIPYANRYNSFKRRNLLAIRGTSLVARTPLPSGRWHLWNSDSRRSHASMYHQSELGEFSDLLPCDMNGKIPERGDDWREMAWGLESMDSCDADLIELLDDIWWPQLIELSEKVRAKIKEMQQ